MYRHIYVPVDNSEHSNAAIDVAVALGKAFGADLVGSHVYAAKMHDYRFRPNGVHAAAGVSGREEMEKQRRIHDSLITMGLQLISDSYLEVMAQKSGGRGAHLQKGDDRRQELRRAGSGHPAVGLRPGGDRGPGDGGGEG